MNSRYRAVIPGVLPRWIPCLLLAICGGGQAVAQPTLCANVGIQLERDAVVSRSAFRGTLTIRNDGTTDLTSLSVVLDLRDPAGSFRNASFGVAVPELSGLNDVNGSGTLPPGAEGTATWLIVPQDDAAPTEPLLYSFGGTLQYVLNGQTLTIPMEPARLTVYPNPRLRVKYFWDKYVYSDDPFTAPVEPAQPFAVGLMMSNVGAGSARNIRITTAQPQITWNDRDLLINFQLLGTQVGDQPQTPSLTVTLGDLLPNQTRVARYLMTSSIQGRFINYSARYQHLDDLGGVVSSLIEEGYPQIFELIRSVKSQEPGADDVPDFLTNQVRFPSDPNESPSDPALADIPDTLHLSDGTVVPVAAVLNAGIQTTGVDTAILSTSPGGSGWRYILVDDPFNGLRPLREVRRSDGRVLLADNAWTTDRVFQPSGFRVIYRSRIHIFDKGGPGVYTLAFGDGSAPPAPPVVSAQPTPVRACVGGAASFGVQAAGSGTLGYQWRRDGAAIAGATQPTLTLTNLSLKDLGSYDVVITSAFGVTTSAAATLDLNYRLRWIEQGATGPLAPRNAPSMAFDSSRGVAVLFGGGDRLGNAQGDTWEWDGARWRLASSDGAAPREFGAMAYDEVRRECVLFGGRDADGFIFGTWAWNGQAWRLASTEGPSPRSHAAMSFDRKRGVIVLFGGFGIDELGSPAVLSDTWEWNGAAWTRRPEPGPSARYAFGAMTYEPASERSILFGGLAGSAVVNDTWAWNGDRWAIVIPSGNDRSPAARIEPALASDIYRKRAMLFGGSLTSTDPLSPVQDTWEWDGVQWTRLPLEPPPARTAAGMVHDANRAELLLFGGLGATGFLSDTWTLIALDPRDYNGDGAVNPDDLGDFISCYFASPPCENADYNRDGFADPDDLSDFISLFFSGC